MIRLPRSLVSIEKASRFMQGNNLGRQDLLQVKIRHPWVGCQHQFRQIQFCLHLHAWCVEVILHAWCVEVDQSAWSSFRVATLFALAKPKKSSLWHSRGFSCVCVFVHTLSNKHQKSSNLSTSTTAGESSRVFFASGKTPPCKRHVGRWFCRSRCRDRWEASRFEWASRRPRETWTPRCLQNTQHKFHPRDKGLWRGWWTGGRGVNWVFRLSFEYQASSFGVSEHSFSCHLAHLARWCSISSPEK